MPGTNGAGLNFRPRMSIEHGQVGPATSSGATQGVDKGVDDLPVDALLPLPEGVDLDSDELDG